MTTSLAELRLAVACVSVPSESGFNAVEWPGEPTYRVGRGLEGSYVLLTPPDPDPDPATSLRRITLAPRLRCRVEDADGSVTEMDAGLVEFRDDTPELVDHFLRVAAALVDALGPQPAAGEVSRSMQQLLKLFESATPSRGSVLGVWGELLVALSSAEPATFVDAWHAQVDDRFDFAAEGSRLEVKTTTRAVRVHRFRLEQLLPVPGASQHVVSITTAESELGSSVGDLVTDLQHRLAGDPLRQMKLLEQVGQILGSDWPATARRTFDRVAGLASLALFEASDIPRVEPTSPRITEVEFSVDLTDLDAADPRQTMGLPVLIAAHQG